VSAAEADEHVDGRGAVTSQRLSRTQRTIARRMVESRSTVPEFELTAVADMGDAVALRAQLKAQAGGGEPVPSLNDMIVRASALALREHPEANGAYADDTFQLFDRVNIGVAVAAPAALLVPTVFDADRLTLAEIGAQTRRLAERVRDRTIAPAELADATFTVSNLGMFRVEHFSAVINPPQAAILAVGAVRRTAVVRGDALVAGHEMRLTLCCDHRILYGADAAQLLARICELLEAPQALLG
jgi:pyruvate dehydrogenase E2 component (dihydrolipoamide acetyltransferase)